MFRIEANWVCEITIAKGKWWLSTQDALNIFISLITIYYIHVHISVKTKLSPHCKGDSTFKSNSYNTGLSSLVPFLQLHLHYILILKEQKSMGRSEKNYPPPPAHKNLPSGPLLRQWEGRRRSRSSSLLRISDVHLHPSLGRFMIFHKRV